jgi:hypothetical protein
MEYHKEKFHTDIIKAALQHAAIPVKSSISDHFIDSIVRQGAGLIKQALSFLCSTLWTVRLEEQWRPK